MGDKFRKLYPHLTDEELIEAQNNFDDYLEVVWRIYERIRNDPAEYKKFKELSASINSLQEENAEGPTDITQSSLFD